GSIDASPEPLDGDCAAPCADAADGGGTMRGAAAGAESFSVTGSSCFDTSCSLSALATRSVSALPDCASPALPRTFLVGVELSAVIAGGGSLEAGPEEKLR